MQEMTVGGYIQNAVEQLDSAADDLAAGRFNRVREGSCYAIEMGLKAILLHYHPLISVEVTKKRAWP